MEGFINIKKIVLNIFDNYSMARFQEEYTQGSLATSLMGREKVQVSTVNTDGLEM